MNSEIQGELGTLRPSDERMVARKITDAVASVLKECGTVSQIICNPDGGTVLIEIDEKRAVLKRI